MLLQHLDRDEAVDRVVLGEQDSASTASTSVLGQDVPGDQPFRSRVVLGPGQDREEAALERLPLDGLGQDGEYVDAVSGWTVSLITLAFGLLPTFG